MAYKKTAQQTTDVSDAVESAFSEAEELRDELQSWYDNLPESFQNGSKGEALTEAIGYLESPSQPDIPDVVVNNIKEDVTYSAVVKKPSRRDRLGACIDRLNAAAEVVRNYATNLEGIDYTEEGEIEDDNSVPPDQLPVSEEERDTWVSELNDLADECENTANEWENVEFPGMFG